MTIGLFTFEVHLPLSHSLKDKRQVVRRIKGRLRARHNVAVVELEDHGNLWQRAGLAIVSVASHRDALVKLFEAVRREAEQGLPGEIIDTGSDFIEAADGGPHGWSGERG